MEVKEVLKVLLDGLGEIATYSTHPQHALGETADSMYRSFGTIIYCQLISRFCTEEADKKAVVERLNALSSMFCSHGLVIESIPIQSLIKQLKPQPAPSPVPSTS